MTPEERVEKGHKAITALCPDPFVVGWISCLGWAIRFEPALERFREETGNKWTPSRVPLERMIDEATGVDLAFILEFTKWFNVNIWGDGTEPEEEEEEIKDEREPFA